MGDDGFDLHLLRLETGHEQKNKKKIIVVYGFQYV